MAQARQMVFHGRNGSSFRVDRNSWTRCKMSEFYHVCCRQEVVTIFEASLIRVPKKYNHYYHKHVTKGQDEVKEKTKKVMKRAALGVRYFVRTKFVRILGFYLFFPVVWCVISKAFSEMGLLWNKLTKYEEMKIRGRCAVAKFVSEKEMKEQKGILFCCVLFIHTQCQIL